jgi:drug/metabolite transporter (DMT)-like permease
MTDRGKVVLSRVGLIYAALIWGTTFFLVKGILTTTDPVTLVAVRFWVASAVMAVVLKVFKKDLWKGFSKGVWLGVFLWLAFVFQTAGLKITTASNSGFITALYVPLVPFLGWILFRTRPDLRHWISVGLSTVGLWILTGGLQGLNLGDLLTLATAGAVALHIVFSEKFVRRDLDPLTLSFQQFLIVALLSTTHALLFGHTWPEWSANFGWQIGYLALFGSITTIAVQTVAQKYLEAVDVAIILTLEPVFAAIFAWTIGGEPWTVYGAVGGAVIVSAMLLSEV